MADARIIEVCNGVAARIKQAWTDANKGKEAEVCTDLEIELEWDKCPAKRTVFVVPSAYGDSPMTRGEDEADYTVIIALVHRQPLQDTRTLSDFAKCEIKWFEDNVTALSEIRELELLGTLHPNSDSGVTLVYDKKNLRENKVFYSEFTITFREVA